MKKLKFGLFAFILVCSSLLMTACDFFSPRVEKLELEYTANLQFLVGEEWADDLIKGTAIYSDGNEKDVTEEMTIDKSDYDKTKVGKYDIKFSFEGIRVGYEVEVVDKITNSGAINSRLAKVIDETFKRNDNVLSFEATKTSEIEDGNFVESLVYVDNNGQISAYTKWTLDDDVILEMHYNGSEDNGIETCIIENEGIIQEYEDWSLESYSSHLSGTAKVLDLPVEVIPSEILALDGDYVFEGELTLDNGIYTFTNGDASLQYKNNILTNINGIEFKFPKDTTTTIPEFTSIQEYMNDVVANSYERIDGQLEISAYDVTELQNGIIIEHHIDIFEDNGEYTICNEFTIDNGGAKQSVIYVFEGTLENGTITVSNSLGDEASEENKDIDYFMECIYSFQESLNERSMDFAIKLFPSNLIYLESSEFYGELTIIEEGCGALTQEVAEGVEFTLEFEDNKITKVNGVFVFFNIMA